MAHGGPIKAVIFDAYGTLFDVYSISTLAEDLFPGRGTKLAELWRDRQIDYSRLRTLSGQYRDFWLITQDALEYAATRLDLGMTAAYRMQLLDQYAQLAAFAEIKSSLRDLAARGFKLGILTNGNDTMIAQNIRAADLDGLFDHILSVAHVRQFKTAPAAYQMGPDAFGTSAGEILFVSSNHWDVCGAAWFGYHTLWVNRAGLPPEQLGISPDAQGADLRAVVLYLDSLAN
jgi:2-haloacid dehalogenase